MLFELSSSTLFFIFVHIICHCVYIFCFWLNNCTSTKRVCACVLKIGAYELVVQYNRRWMLLCLFFNSFSSLIFMPDSWVSHKSCNNIIKPLLQMMMNISYICYCLYASTMDLWKHILILIWFLDGISSKSWKQHDFFFLGGSAHLYLFPFLYTFWPINFVQLKVKIIWFLSKIRKLKEGDTLKITAYY